MAKRADIIQGAQQAADVEDETAARVRLPDDVAGEHAWVLRFLPRDLQSPAAPLS